MKAKTLLLTLVAVALTIPSVFVSNAKTNTIDPFGDEVGYASDEIFVNENAPVNHYKKNAALEPTSTAPQFSSKFGIQVSDPANGKRSVRFIAEVSSLNCSVKWTRTIETLGEDGRVSDDDQVFKAEATVDCDAAYTSVVSGSSTYKASTGYYLVVYTMNNVPEACWDYVFNISASLTYLDADSVEQTVSTTTRKANIYGGLCISTLNGNDASYSSGNITSSSAISATLEKDATYPAVAYKVINEEQVSSMSFGSDTTTIAAVSFSEKTGNASETNGKGSDYANYTSPYTDLESVAFECSTVNIGDFAFAGCTGLTDITWPTGKNGIPATIDVGYGSFANTGITKIDIPDSRYIQAYAFGGCQKLKEVTIYNECLCDNELADNPVLEKVTFAEECNKAIDQANKVQGGINWFSGGLSDHRYKRVFKNSTAIKEVYVYCDTVESRPNIWKWAYEDCAQLTTFVATGKTFLSPAMFEKCTSLSNVTITTKLRSIQANAFKDCGSTNVTINYNGTLEQWNSLTKGSNWYVGANITVVATDGTTSYQGL